MSQASSVEPLLLSGTIPGLVDPLQRARLLRTPTTKLSFASFDPFTARPSFPNLNDLHIDEKHGNESSSESKPRNEGKRIVIETDTDSGLCSWRFVPRAKGELGVNDDGVWPRVVELCGLIVRMTEDQWDLHKLDPNYDCFLRNPPNLPIITRLDTPSANVPPLRATSVPKSEFSTPKGKANSIPEEDTPTPKKREGDEELRPPRRDPPGEPLDPYGSSSRESTPLPKGASTIDTDYDSDKMSIDDDSFYIHNTAEFPSSPSNNDNSNKRTKRRRYTQRLDKETPTRKRQPEMDNGSQFSSHNGNEQPTKKSRVHSPQNAKREFDLKRIERDRKRRNELHERMLNRRNNLHQHFWSDKGIPTALNESELYNFPPDTEPRSEPNDGVPSPRTPTPEEDDDEAARLAKIEESRRKLAELEKDKPMWEESARLRQQMEQAEDLARQREKQMRDEERRREAQATAAYARRHAQWRVEMDAQARALRRNAQGGRMVVSVSYHEAYRWTPQVAIDRYIATAAKFDAAIFTSKSPPTFASIPWPMLQPSFSLNDIEWDAIESFFATAERLLSADDIRAFMDKSHKRFHPDRWRSRRLLASVENELDRDLLEVAVSTVSQALTPMWKNIMERTKG
ncbi:hypothetical protein BU17DRAFT_35727 [Hysterangium stoloniferum]|nr:hypothetical protein BU17DRAFT_35727 [Hysterangium stoloniferum]